MKSNRRLELEKMDLERTKLDQEMNAIAHLQSIIHGGSGHFSPNTQSEVEYSNPLSENRP